MSNLSRLFLLCAFISLLGCNKSSVNRHDVWGTVQWKGKPIPSGILYISPDVRKGNRGVQGVAMIKEGKFDTRTAHGKGGVTGAVLIRVDGTDGKPLPYYPYGKPIFGPEKPLLEAQIKEGGAEMQLVVPDNFSSPSTNIEPLN